MKQRILRAVRTWATLVVVGTGVITGALRAQDTSAAPCSNATFSGLYGLSVEGVLLFPDTPGPVPFNVAGLMQADGMGKLTVFRQMTNAGGAVLPLDWAAVAQPAVEYSVNADCTATIEFFVPGGTGIPIVPPDGMPFAASMVLVNGGREAIGIQSSPPNAVLTVRLARTDVLNAQLESDVNALKADAAATKAILQRVAVKLGLVP